MRLMSSLICSLYFVGKGVTYDTGGADIKCDGHMRGNASATKYMNDPISLLSPQVCRATSAVRLLWLAFSRQSNFFNQRASMPLQLWLWYATLLALIHMSAMKFLYPEMATEVSSKKS